MPLIAMRRLRPLRHEVAVNRADDAAPSAFCETPTDASSAAAQNRAMRNAQSSTARRTRKQQSNKRSSAAPYSLSRK